MTSADRPCDVAVFDAALPPGVAFIRSLGRAGVPVRAHETISHAPGRFSRFSSSFGVCPDPQHIDEFADWLEAEVSRGLRLVAPTSDYVSFVVAEVEERLGRDLSGGVGGKRGADGVRDCLFKNRFATRLAEVGFPTPATATATNIDDAVLRAAEIGYPIVLKPRSHIGLGVGRGVVVDDEADLRRHFGPATLDVHQAAALRHDPDLAYPMLQQMLVRDSLDCISVTGCLDRDGDVTVAGCSRKIDQWGEQLAIGTLFESCDPPPFLAHALEAVREILGTGIFELEVLFDQATGEYWAIDLNPRGFGQMSLDIGRGDCLPLRWYESAIRSTAGHVRPRRRKPELWMMGTPYFAGVATRLLARRGRLAYLGEVGRLLARPRVGAMFAWTDPVPGLLHAALVMVHPGGLVRPFLRAIRAERTASPSSSHRR